LFPATTRVLEPAFIRLRDPVFYQAVSMFQAGEDNP